MVDLPKVEQSFEADATKYLAGIEEMIQANAALVRSVEESVAQVNAALATIPDEKNVKVELNEDDVLEQVAYIRELLNGIPDHKNVVVTVEQMGNATGAGDAGTAGEALVAQAEAAREDAGAQNQLLEVLNSVAEADNLLARTTGIQDEAQRSAADSAGLLADAVRATAAATKDAGGAASDAKTAFETLGAVSFTAAARMNSLGGIIHWIIAGGSELAATLLPAMVAIGAAASVQLEGWGDLYTRMNAVNTVGQSIGGAFGKTVGQILGMGDALQKAQTAADPQVFEMLGAAINAVNQSSGQFIPMGQQLTGFMDQFAAKIDVDLKNGMTQFTGLIGKGVEDAVEFGQVLGNMGHALLNFASDMPGLAEVLLKIIDGISELILWISKLPPWIITTLMVFEELFRWGGLLVGVFAQIGEGMAAMGFLGLPIIGKIVLQFGEMFKMIALGAVGFVGNMGQMVTGIGKFVTGAENAGGALTDFDEAATAAIGGLDTGLVGVGVAAALGLGALILWMVNSKNATQQWVDNLEQSVNAAKGLQQIGQTYTSLGQVTSALTGAQKQLNTAMAAPGGQIVGSMTRFQGYSDAVEAASVKVGTLSQAQQQLSTDFGTEIGNVDLLSTKYKIGYVEAAELAGDAGANLTQTMKGNTTAAQINLQMVENYVQGLGGMGAVQGALGADINAVTIQEDLQASKTQQLTQAMSGLMSTIQGPSSGFLSMAQSLVQFKTDAGAAGATMTGLGGEIGKVTTTFPKMNQASLQLQQDFNSTVSSMQSYTNSMTTAAAITGNGGPMVQALKDEVAILLPMAGSNKSAAAQIMVLWQEAGGSASDSLSQIGQAVKGIKNPLTDLQTLTGNVSMSLANLGQDASNLANTISTSLNQTLVTQAEQLTGVSGKADIYLQALQQYGPNSAQAQAALNNMNSATSEATELASEAAAGVTALSGNVQKLGAIASDTQADRTALNNDVAGIEKNAPNASKYVSDLATAIQDSGLKSSTTASARAQLIKDLENAGVNAQTATKEVDGLATAISKLQNKTVTITTQLITQGAGASGGINPSALPGVTKGATGFLVPGHGSGDTVPAMLTPGEAVVPKHLVSAVAPFLSSQHVPGFALGGLIPGFASGGTVPTSPWSGGNLLSNWYDYYKGTLPWETSQDIALRSAAASQDAAAFARFAIPTSIPAPQAASPQFLGSWLPSALAGANLKPEQYVTPGSAGGQGQTLEATTPANISLKMDGKTVWQGQQQHTLKYNIRNNGIATGLQKPR